MAQFRCPKCPKGFDTEHGLSVHNKRMHTAAGKRWGKGVQPKNPARKGSVKEKMSQVLARHPEGLQIHDIVSGMKKLGWRPSGKGAGYVSTLASSDPSIIRVERGVYRLTTKNLVQKRTQRASTPAVAVAEPAVTDMPQEALLVRIEQLERENACLSAAHQSVLNTHLSFVRELTNHD